METRILHLLYLRVVWSWRGEKFNMKMNYTQLPIYGEAHKESSWWWNWAVKTVLLKKPEEEIFKMHMYAIQLAEAVRASYNIYN